MSHFVRSASALALGLALMFGALAGTAEAQNGYQTQNPRIIYQAPGPINNVPAEVQASANARKFLSPATAASASTGGGTGGSGNLAFTGGNTDVVAAGGLSLILIGGAAVLASRKRS